jgi:hypothetical protein
MAAAVAELVGGRAVRKHVERPGFSQQCDDHVDAGDGNDSLFGDPGNDPGNGS